MIPCPEMVHIGNFLMNGRLWSAAVGMLFLGKFSMIGGSQEEFCGMHLCVSVHNMKPFVSSTIFAQTSANLISFSFISCVLGGLGGHYFLTVQKVKLAT